jgi:hypothetical protein
MRCSAARRIGAFAALAAAFASATSCEALYPLNGLGPPSGDAGNADGNSASDAASDSATCDAGSGYCACLSPPPKFCDDFERSDPQGPWTDSTGVLEIVDSADDHKRALHVTAGSGSAPSVSKHINESVTAVHYSFDLKLRTAGSGTCGGMSVFLPPDFQSRQAEPEVQLRDVNGKVALRDSIFPAGSQATLDLGQIPLNSWVRVKLDLSLADKRATLTVSGVGSMTADPSTPNHGFMQEYASGPLVLIAGSSFASSPLDFLVDNVVADYEP